MPPLHPYHAYQRRRPFEHSAWRKYPPSSPTARDDAAGIGTPFARQRASRFQMGNGAFLSRRRAAFVHRRLFFGIYGCTVWERGNYVNICEGENFFTEVFPLVLVFSKIYILTFTPNVKCKLRNIHTVSSH